MTNIEQLSGMLGKFGMNGLHTPKEAFMEYIKLLPGKEKEGKLKLAYTSLDNSNRIFEHGCDYVVKRFEEEFESNF